MTELFLWMVSAHIVADFVLQTPAIAEAECAGSIRGYVKHAVGHLLTLVLFTHQYISLAMVALWLIIPVVHTLTDWAENRLVPLSHPADALASSLTRCFISWSLSFPCGG
ncbi:MAG: DUF3307 domain-containing protein [Bacillota bacterium]